MRWSDRLARLPAKAATHLSLLRHDPERFARNVLQFTNPALFEERLIDIMNAKPMHVSIDSSLAVRPTLNVLNSALTPSGMTGGPNTIINLALRIARAGVPVRLMTTVETSTITPEWFARHAMQLVGGTLPDVPIVSAADPEKPFPIGPRDIFMATHWSTAQQMKDVLPRMAQRQFFYMLQEFEPAFYAWSSNYALALETFGLDFWPIFNEQVLADYLLGQPLGRFADPVMRERATVFEPAIEERLFHPATIPQAPRPKRLLFYARPTNTRNMFGLALTALRQASASPEFHDWEFLSIGGRGSVPDMALGGVHRLRPAPWMDYNGYAASLREADVLLCPMLSPHTSYPVLEMAACGGLSVTNTFATKTAATFGELSANVLAVEPTIKTMAAALVQAATRINAGHDRSAPLHMARDWADTLDPVAAKMESIFRSLSHALAPKAAPAL